MVNKLIAIVMVHIRSVGVIKHWKRRGDYMDKSQFVKRAVKHMTALKRKKQFRINPVKKHFIDIQDYENHICRNSWRQIYKPGEKRRNRV